MEEEAFIFDMEQEHHNLSREMCSVVDLYKQAIVAMQGEVDQLVHQLFFSMKEQLKNFEEAAIHDRFSGTKNRIKMLRSLHKSMASMEGAFAVLKDQYAHVLSCDEDRTSTLSDSIDSER